MAVQQVRLPHLDDAERVSRGVHRHRRGLHRRSRFRVAERTERACAADGPAGSCECGSASEEEPCRAIEGVRDPRSAVRRIVPRGHHRRDDRRGQHGQRSTRGCASATRQPELAGRRALPHPHPHDRQVDRRDGRGLPLRRASDGDRRRIRRRAHASVRERARSPARHVDRRVSSTEQQRHADGRGKRSDLLPPTDSPLASLRVAALARRGAVDRALQVAHAASLRLLQQPWCARAARAVHGQEDPGPGVEEDHRVSQAAPRARQRLQVDGAEHPGRGDEGAGREARRRDRTRRDHR